MVTVFIKLLILFLFIVLIIGIIRTFQMEHSQEQAIFLRGVLPDPKPEGLYNGNVSGHKVSWLGKKFSSLNSTGVNLFDDGKGGKTEKYSFVTSIGKGTRDKEFNVFKIDYDISSNPFWLRFILDEIVQTAPNTYLGKLQLRIIPGLSFTLGYFKLQK